MASLLAASSVSIFRAITCPVKTSLEGLKPLATSRGRMQHVRCSASLDFQKVDHKVVISLTSPLFPGFGIALATASGLLLDAMAMPALADQVSNPEFPMTPQDQAGWAVVVLSCILVAVVLNNGRMKIAEIKAELAAKGIDTTGIERIAMLKYLKGMVDAGEDLELAREMIAANSARREIQFGGGDKVVKWRKYYAERGVTLTTIRDLKLLDNYIDTVRERSAQKKKLASPEN